MANVVLKCKKYGNPEVVWYPDDSTLQEDVCKDCKHSSGCNPDKCVMTPDMWTQADCRAIAFDMLTGDRAISPQVLREIMKQALMCMTQEKQREFAEYLLIHPKL
jgi:hypothetical protein